MNPIKTDFLVSAGSILIGAGSVMNISGNYFSYNISSSAEAADRRALASDWMIVGQDIRTALLKEKAALLSSDPQLSLAL